MPLPKPITVEEFFGPPTRSRALLSPDGTKVAYLAPWRERLNVFVRDVDSDWSTPRRRPRRPAHHLRHPAQRRHLLLVRRRPVPALPAGHRRRRELAPAPRGPGAPRRAHGRPDALRGGAPARHTAAAGPAGHGVRAAEQASSRAGRSLRARSRDRRADPGRGESRRRPHLAPHRRPAPCLHDGGER
ncbi:peptidase S9, prolyl oligopeptidase active site domain protein [Pseudonocardia sp. Ae168_Ps1]|nr:peptidase S9, prolyl oligopeptidase active site domain protein [Pseudonocardia sp. Ae150A_Ps1]OLL81254.1 peptidase S9, prolyl oligopeptidase active site domain protein [Pseudonocardia sp. Ae168_Ps1]OLL84631.1 peptidase S9, prolyl oligopeptidase active site domain protein [Pseudonocardia sp. Ae263_Ps1]OLL95352.1 peptidase S9, prolyl oligopeptidase active site domain protein [Pseudonocardia sp. Ae356_Ps1]